MKLTINIETDESGTMTATVPEVPGLVVEADDLGEIFAEITDLIPEMAGFDFVMGRNMPNKHCPKLDAEWSAPATLAEARLMRKSWPGTSW